MVDPDSHGAGYNSPKGSWELPTGSNAQTGAFWREQDQARSAASSGSASPGGVQGLDFSSSSQASGQGGILGAGIAIESAILVLTFYGKRINLASFFGPDGLKLLVIVLATFAAYAFLAYRIPLFRWVTLCLFSAYAFTNLIYPYPSQSTWAYIGYIFIGLMVFDRFFFAIMRDRKTSFGKVATRLAFCVGAPAVLCMPSSVATMSGLFGAADKTFGLTASSQLRSAGFGVAKVPIAYMTYDAAHDRYAMQRRLVDMRGTTAQEFGGTLPTGSVIRLYKVTHAGAFACVNHNLAFIDTPDLLKPYSGTGEVSGITITRNYTDETCPKVIPARLDD